MKDRRRQTDKIEQRMDAMGKDIADNKEVLQEQGKTHVLILEIIGSLKTSFTTLESSTQGVVKAYNHLHSAYIVIICVCGLFGTISATYWGLLKLGWI